MGNHTITCRHSFMYEIEQQLYVLSYLVIFLFFFFRFQITFHKPTYSRTTSRKKRDRCRSLPTENVLLEERTAEKISESGKTSQKSLDNNGDAGIHLGP